MPITDFNFSFPFRVRYAEVDCQKIVFNAHYLTYFDTAITEYFRALPYDYMGQVERTGTDFHTVRTVIDYAAPIDFDAEIDVHVRVARLGRSSLRFGIEIHPAGTESLFASGEVVWVNTDLAAHKSTPVPDELVTLIMAREGDQMEQA